MDMVGRWLRFASLASSTVIHGQMGVLWDLGPDFVLPVPSKLFWLLFLLKVLAPLQVLVCLACKVGMLIGACENWPDRSKTVGHIQQLLRSLRMQGTSVMFNLRTLASAIPGSMGMEVHGGGEGMSGGGIFE